MCFFGALSQDLDFFGVWGLAVTGLRVQSLGVIGLVDLRLRVQRLGLGL